MKEIPCKGCIIQPVCTQKCSDLLDYRKYMLSHGVYSNYHVEYREYMDFSGEIFNRKYRNHQGQLK